MKYSIKDSKLKLYKLARSLGFPAKFVGTSKDTLISYIDKNKSKKQEKILKPKRKTEKQKLYEKAVELGLTTEYNKITAKNIKLYIEEKTKLIIPFIQSNEAGIFDASNTDINSIINQLISAEYNREKFRYFIRIEYPNGKIKNFTLTPNYISKIYNNIGPEEYQSGSDPESYFDAINIHIIKELIVAKPRSANGFLPFILSDYTERNCNFLESFRKLKEAWYRYVPNESSNIDCIGNCIQIAEEEGTIPEDSLNKYKQYRLNNQDSYELRKKDFEPLSKLLNIAITISAHEKTTHYNKKAEHKLHLYSIDNHCFLYEKTKFTLWSLEEGYTNDKLISKFIDLEYKNSKSKVKKYIYNCILDKNDNIAVRNQDIYYINSARFLNLMINSKLTTKMPQAKILDQINYNFDISYSSNIAEGQCSPNNNIKHANSPFGKNKSYIRLFADFETIEHNNILKADLLVVRCDNITKIYSSIEEDISELFLLDIKNGFYGESDNFIVIFHNLGFDFNFIAKTKGLSIISRIQKSASKLACSKTKYYNKNIYFKDSYSVIPSKLADFDKMFNIPNIKKGACPHGYYNIKTLKLTKAPISKARKYIKKEEIDDFNQSIEEYSKGSYFDHINYRIDYCIQDVNVLQKGYMIFRQWIMDYFEEELDFCISVPQIAFNYVNNESCFTNVNPLSSISQEYLQKYIRGGKCMSNNNEKYIVKEIMDFDCTSLYPSAMIRPDMFIPTSQFRKLTEKELNYDYLKTKPYYYVEISIKNVPKHRAFPCIYTEKDSWTNTPTEICYVSKVALEDIIKYHKLTNKDYEILGGIVYDKKDTNNKLKETVTYLFNKRAELKAQKNPAQQIFKLMLNSVYGRMLMKPINTYEKFFDTSGDKFKKYIHKHYNHIKSYEIYGDSKAIVTRYKSILSHQNYVNIACNILDVSKRIMNEVMYLAEDNNIQIFYQDTDSMHMYNKDIAKLCSLFKKKYNRDLEGTKLGQFHGDFDTPIGYTNTISETCIILGKKCYLDHCRCSNKEGDIYFDHIRMKGVPKQAILSKCKDLQISPLELYMKMYNGSGYNFDLLSDNGVSFEFNNFEVSSKKKFLRFVKF